jgi:2-phosphoglycolate phosphatase
VKPARAIIFDLDGTLADTRLDIAATCNHALASFGRAPKTVNEIARYVGDGSRNLVARAFDSPPDSPLVDEAFACFNAYYALHAADHATWMPGAREALDACAHLPLALVTNKPRTATIPLLQALGVASRFEVVIAGGDGPLKPDPAAIHAALKPLGVCAADAWVVGDGPQDIGAGKAANTWTVAVLGGFANEASLRDARPDRLIASLRLLPALLDERAATGLRTP